MDMYDGAPLPENPRKGYGLPGARKGTVPILRMYGVTAAGNSVCAHIHGFTPYFWTSPPPGMEEKDIPAWQAALDATIGSAKAKARVDQGILAVEMVPNKQSILGYNFDRLQTMLKVYTAMPTMVPAAKSQLEGGLTVPTIAGGERRKYLCYEANVPFVLRFMIDQNIVGCNWCEVPASTYSLRPASRRVSTAQIELDVVYDSLVSHAPEGEWQRVAPLRILSFDIECQGRKGHFPEAEHDPVIQVANVVTLQGASTSLVRNVFTFRSCSPIVGAGVHSYDREEDMLEAWARFVVDADPDVVTGYNVQNFDIPYLLNRMRKLKVESAQILGRIKGVKATMRDTTFQSSAHGKQENVETQLDGRVIFDMLQYCRREHKLSSYSLNSVSAHFLGQQKEDVHHSIIADLQAGTDDDRRRLAVYCLKDAFLPQRLMDKLMVLINHVEMARVTGVPLDFLLSRGQQIKVISMLYRKCRPLGLLVPTVPRYSGQGGEGEETFEGATVIEPVRGFYDVPIATLDFASLYPSIMMAHNLCYSTLVGREDVKKLDPAQIEKTPDEDIFFVRASTKKGVLPMILEELLAARKRAKTDMAKATDPFVIAVQNGRQLALKISANSVYGFTGATVGQLPCIEISSSVTAYGRTMIAATKLAVEAKYTITNGYPANAQVVYGDTDSVMVKFGVPDVPTAMKLGAEAAKEVTKLFPPPVKLEFEKVYFPFLLMNKKRYAGMYYSKPDKPDKMDTKGIETVRRDNCALVRTVIDTCLHMILEESSVDAAIRYTKGVIADLLQNKIDLSMLVITKALGKGADNEGYKVRQAHVELAERMRKRDPGSAPVVGDRVPFVIIEGAKGAPTYEKSEDPLYVLENSLPIDTRYYLDNQLNGPLTRIFEPIIDNVNSLFTGDHTRTISVRRRVGGWGFGCGRVGALRPASRPPPSPTVCLSHLLLPPPLTLAQKPTPTGKTGIMAFTVKKARCMACKATIDERTGSATLCGHCLPKEPEVYRKHLLQVNDLEDKFARLWTQCQRCQGSLHVDVLCASKDCEIFYARKKVQKDLADATTELSRFGIGW
jgi:DNA polymerase delta subunit 1